MSKKDELYDGFAQLLYSVIMADDVFDSKELQLVDTLLKGHPLRNYLDHYMDTADPDISIAQSSKLVLDLCRENGFDAEYPFLIEVLEEIAHAGRKKNGNDATVIEAIVESFRSGLSKLTPK